MLAREAIAQGVSEEIVCECVARAKRVTDLRDELNAAVEATWAFNKINSSVTR